MTKTSRNADKIIDRFGQDRVRYGIGSESYMNPETISKAMNQKIRVEKEEETQWWEEGLTKARFDFPDATE